MVAQDSFLKTAKPEERFVLANGRTLKNLHELRNSLLSMDKATFGHHVTSHKNDFASWVEHVFSDSELAEALRGVTTAQGMYAVLNGSQRKSAQKDMSAPRRKKRAAPRPKKKVSPSQAPEPQKMAPIEDPGYDEHTTLVPLTDDEIKSHPDMRKKLDEILLYEKELATRERKIQEIEERIEKDLSGELETHTLSKEFVQGFVAGVLVAVIAILLYVNLV